MAYTPWKLTSGNREFTFERPVVMGILNVTPDSFSGDGIYPWAKGTAIVRARNMVNEGADIIDVGGESTRPGSEPISLKEEMYRVVPIVEALVSELAVPISVDTTKPEVAEWCLKRGAHMINDVSGLRNDWMRKVVATYHVPAVIMHMQGTPQTMQIDPHYNTDVVTEIAAYLKIQAVRAKQAGIEQVIVDPGIGFGKTTEHNLLILRDLARFKELGFPLMVGVSRKGFIGVLTDRAVDERLAGTLGAVTACVLNGADIIRVHDVKQCKDAMLVAHAIGKTE